MSNLHAPTKCGKIMILAAAVIFVFLISAAVIISIQSRKENKKFLMEGVRVKGTVLSLEESGTRKDRNYSMMISMFVKGPEEKMEKLDTLHKTKPERIIDSIFAKAIINVNDTYQTVNINVSNASYYGHKIGDRVDVVYLKENPKKVKLLEEIDDL